jgi:hypothetical protein
MRYEIWNSECITWNIKLLCNQKNQAPLHFLLKVQTKSERDKNHDCMKIKLYRSFLLDGLLQYALRGTHLAMNRTKSCPLCCRGR